MKFLSFPVNRQCRLALFSISQLSKADGVSVLTAVFYNIVIFLLFQHWKDISLLAKDFIDKLLLLDPNERMTAAEALRHGWVESNAASSSNKNLHQTVSQNLMQRYSSRANSTNCRSVRSVQSNKSLRSDHRHVSPEEIDELHQDPEVQADIESLHNYSIPSYSK